MPFDGNGNWTSNYYPQSGELIKASDFNTDFVADIANGFGNCVTRDGQGVMQTNTNANNYRVINVADPVAEKDAVNLKIFDTLYPVGSIYIGTQATCPLASIIAGSTWQKIEGRYLLASGTLTGTSETYSATNTVGSGAPNITGKKFNVGMLNDATSSGALYRSDVVADSGYLFDGYGAYYERAAIAFDASHSNAIYGSSQAVRAPAYVVNVWRRTA